MNTLVAKNTKNTKNTENELNEQFLILQPHVTLFSRAIKKGDNDRIVEYLRDHGYSLESVLRIMDAFRNLEKRVLNSPTQPRGLLPKIRRAMKQVDVLEVWLEQMIANQDAREKRQRRAASNKIVGEIESMVQEFRNILTTGVTRAGRVIPIRDGQRNNLNLNGMNNLGRRMAALDTQIQTRANLLSPEQKKRLSQYQGVLYQHETDRVQGERLFRFIDLEVQRRHRGYIRAFGKVKYAVLAIQRGDYRDSRKYLLEAYGDLKDSVPLDFTFVNKFIKYTARDLNMLRKEIRSLMDLLDGLEQSQEKAARRSPRSTVGTTSGTPARSTAGKANSGRTGSPTIEIPVPTSLVDEESYSVQIREFLSSPRSMNMSPMEPFMPGQLPFPDHHTPVTLVTGVSGPRSSRPVGVISTRFPGIVLFLAVMGLLIRFLSKKSHKRLLARSSSSVNARRYSTDGSSNNENNTATSSRR